MQYTGIEYQTIYKNKETGRLFKTIGNASDYLDVSKNCIIFTDISDGKTYFCTEDFFNNNFEKVYLYT